MNISSTQWANLRESIGHINVKFFGAIGDGVADDTVAIQAAVDAGTMGVFFPAGKYVVTSPIEITSQRNIFGDAQAIGGLMGTQILNQTTADYAFNVTATTPWTTSTNFKNMTIIDPDFVDWGPPPVIGARGGIRLFENQNDHIENVSFFALDTGILVDNSACATIEKCQFFCCTNGIATSLCGNATHVLDCYMHSIQGVGINLNASSGECRINNTVMEGDTPDIGIQIDGINGYVEGCYFEGIPYPIVITGSWNTLLKNFFTAGNKSVTVSGSSNQLLYNDFVGATTCDVYFDTGASQNLIQDNGSCATITGPLANRIGYMIDNRFWADFELRYPGAGFVCQTPTTGKYYRISVDDAGTVMATLV